MIHRHQRILILIGFSIFTCFSSPVMSSRILYQAFIDSSDLAPSVEPIYFHADKVDDRSLKTMTWHLENISADACINFQDEYLTFKSGSRFNIVRTYGVPRVLDIKIDGESSEHKHRIFHFQTYLPQVKEEKQLQLNFGKWPEDFFYQYKINCLILEQRINLEKFYPVHKSTLVLNPKQNMRFPEFFDSLHGLKIQTLKKEQHQDNMKFLLGRQKKQKFKIISTHEKGYMRPCESSVFDNSDWVKIKRSRVY